jgi:LPS-assembly protein
MAMAEDRWALCGAPLLKPVTGDPTLRAAADTPVDITAERSRIVGDPPVYVFNGDVRLTRADQTFTTESLRYNSDSGRVLAENGARLRQSGLLLDAERADYSLSQEAGEFDNVSEYRISSGHLQGRAATIVREGPVQSRYHDVTLSTCMPGDELWVLSASRASLNTDTRQGRAWNAVLSIHDWPVFYTPYLQFPIGDERMSGFLAPTIGVSDTNGTTVSVPWYWNIAPNYDATITPTSYWKRGLLMDTEFRYLEESLEGEIASSYLPDDDRFGDDRWAINQQHKLTLGSSLTGSLRQQRTSDTDFSDHFGDEFDYRSNTFLESDAELTWAEQGWLASIDAQHWQRVEADATEPLARRPRIQLGYSPYERVGPFAYNVASEWTDFYSDDRSRQQGTELNVSPKVSLPIRRLGYYVEPAVAWQYTAFDLENPEGNEAKPSVDVPIYTIDTGLHLERPKTLFSGVYQTLEPRVLYRNIPDEGQDTLPAFASSSTDGTFSRLFRGSKFGIGHTEQITTGVTTRYIDSRRGREYLQFSAGQTFFLHDDRERNRSDYITELRLSLPAGFSAEVDYRWDPENSTDDDLRGLLRYETETEQSIELGFGRERALNTTTQRADIRWRGSNREVVNIGWQRKEDNAQRSLDEIEFSLALPVSASVEVFAGITRDLESHRTTEGLMGIQQSGCCHSWRLISKHGPELNDGDGPPLEQEILFELELRGLAGIGDKVRPFLTDEIDGYNPGR